MSEYTPSMDMIRRAYVSVNGARAVYSRAADDDRALVGRNFDRAIAARDTATREAVLVEAAHAVLLERTRIVEWLSIRQAEEHADFDKSGLEIDQERGLVLDVVKQEIERGAHNEVTK